LNSSGRILGVVLSPIILTRRDTIAKYTHYHHHTYPFKCTAQSDRNHMLTGEKKEAELSGIFSPIIKRGRYPHITPKFASSYICSFAFACIFLIASRCRACMSVVLIAWSKTCSRYCWVTSCRCLFCKDWRFSFIISARR